MTHGSPPRPGWLLARIVCSEAAAVRGTALPVSAEMLAPVACALVPQGVEVLDVYCVDNILARLGDPLFLGYCASRGAQCGARAVAKAYPEEKVGCGWCGWAAAERMECFFSCVPACLHA